VKAKIDTKTGLATVDLSANELHQLFSDLGSDIASLARSARKAALPQYAECARGLYEIATIVRHCMWNVTKTSNDFIYFSFEKSRALEEIQRMCRPFIEQNASQIASELKFNCGEIDSIYMTHCDRLLQSIYAKVVKSARRQKMQKALQQMKHHDAEMIGFLVTSVIMPIATFSREVLKTRDLQEAKRLHTNLVSQIENSAEKAEQILDRLDEAVRSFANLAKTSLRSLKTDGASNYTGAVTTAPR
jgi:hypothetical protein